MPELSQLWLGSHRVKGEKAHASIHPFSIGTSCKKEGLLDNLVNKHEQKKSWWALFLLMFINKIIQQLAVGG